MESPELARAVEAGRAAASDLGLQADDATVVHNSDRVALRLDPCGVLARVAPVEDLPGSEFEVEVARRLAGTAAPVAELDPRVEPRVYERDAFAVSLWTYYEPQKPEIAPSAYAEALRRHHAALRRVRLDAPHVTDRVAAALAVVDDRERSPELPGRDRELLSRTLGEVGAELGGGQGAGSRGRLLHGEPHPGNLLSTRRGPLFVDLATCCRGPVEFDLAHAPEEAQEHYAGADHRLTLRCRALNWAMFSAWRWRRTDQMPGRDRLRVTGLENVRAALSRCEPG